MPEDRNAAEDLQRFEEKYERVLSEDPSSVAFIFLAQVLYKQGKVDKAIKVLINGLKHNKKSVTGRFLLGKIYYDRWMIDQARKEFKTVVELAPDNLAACRMLVQIYRSEEELGTALHILRTAQSYHPHDAGIVEEIDEIEKGIGPKHKKDADFQSVKDRIKSMLDSRTEDELASSMKKYEGGVATETLADLYIGQGLYENACAVLEAVLQNEPGNEWIGEKLERTRLLLINKTAGFTTGR